MLLPSRELEQDTEVCREGYMFTGQEPGHMARKNCGDSSTAIALCYFGCQNSLSISGDAVLWASSESMEAQT